MSAKTWTWVAGGFTMGTVASLALSTLLFLQINPYMQNHRQTLEQTVINKIIEKGLNNSQVQTAMQAQIITYINSPEGRSKIAESLKSPEILKMFSDNIQTPEIKASITKLLQTPEVQTAVIASLKDTPELKLLTTLSSAIVLEENKQQTPRQLNINSKKEQLPAQQHNLNF